MMSDLRRLRAKRALLRSGLFDAEFYRDAYADLRASPVDPLTHYLTEGEAEGRSPNPVFLPAYYRRHAMALAPAEQNALAHYAEDGERLGYRPHPAFDPRAYIAANPALGGFVDRPLLHFLAIGRQAGLPVAPGPRGQALARVLQVQCRGNDVAASGWRDHAALMRYKQAVVRELGIEEGFAVYRAALGLPRGSRLDPRPVAGLHEFAKTHAAAFHEIAPGGERFVNPAPPVIGDGADNGRTRPSRASFFACLIDARIRRRSGIIEVGGAVLFGSQGGQPAPIDEALAFDPAVFHAIDATAWLIESSREANAVELDEGFMLLGPHSDDFANWMADLLPRYLAASMSGALPPVPILIDASLPAPQRQCLELMLPAGVAIIPLASGATRVRRLWCAPSPERPQLSATPSGPIKWVHAPPLPHFAALVGEMVRRAEPILMVATGQERVYLDDEAASERTLANSAEIKAAAVARGFAVVDLGDFDVSEQIRLLRHARLVVGQGSSMLPLAMFAQPGTRLCYLSDRDTSDVASWTAALQQIGIEAAILTGPHARGGGRHAGTSEYRIEPAAFCRLLDSWSDQPLPLPIQHDSRPL